MGFTVVGPDHFLGSGHPDLRDDLPPLLGLIESRDAGETWKPISLLGEVDFHVLRVRDRRVVGYDATSGRVLRSGDRGRTWTAGHPPEPLYDVVVDPISADVMLAPASQVLSSRGTEAGRGTEVPSGPASSPGPAATGCFWWTPTAGRGSVTTGARAGAPLATSTVGQRRSWPSMQTPSTPRRTRV